MMADIGLLKEDEHEHAKTPVHDESGNNSFIYGYCLDWFFGG